VPALPTSSSALNPQYHPKKKKKKKEISFNCFDCGFAGDTMLPFFYFLADF
jgi:hypothetical protein